MGNFLRGWGGGGEIQFSSTPEETFFEEVTYIGPFMILVKL